MTVPANCPCNEFVFPPALRIDAGLPELPRQLASFPQWRRGLLQSIALSPALADWRARETGDFGLMLVEMAAYLCDVVAFYDQVFAQESYVRTARRRVDLRQLVSVLGYLPRPASSAVVDLALLATGRKIVSLPAGTAFRSGAFGAEPPQVFELLEPVAIDPLANEWRLLPVRPSTLGAVPAGGLGALLCLPGTVAVRAGEVIVVETSGFLAARAVAGVSAHTGDDGVTYARLAFDSAVPFAPETPLADIRLWGGGAIGSLWRMPAIGTPPAVIDGNQVVLEGVNRRIALGDLVVLRRGADRRCFRVTGVSEGQRTLLAAMSSSLTDSANNVSTLLSPDIKAGVTTLTLDRGVNDGAGTAWGAAEAASVCLHHGFSRAAVPVRELKTTLSREDTPRIRWPAPHPASSPGRFLLEDVDGDGVDAAGSLSFATRIFSASSNAVWPVPLDQPVRLFGNVGATVRGEAVHGEVLGRGDARLDRQTFKLGRKPLSYHPAASAGNEQSLLSSLAVYVGGVRWSERRSFFDARPDEPIYIVRHDEAGEAFVTFGGGARLQTGAVVVADYRFGAGAASPPAGSLTQLAKPVPGLKSVRNPVAAAGGGDAESAADLALLAPRSALLLGRAVSIDDFEVAAATVPGVRAVDCAWRWNGQRQRPVVQIDYVGGAGLAKLISEKLHGLCDPTVPIAVAQATPLPARIALEIVVAQAYVKQSVLNGVRDRLTRAPDGFLLPEQRGINRPLFESALFEAVSQVEGIEAIAGLTWGWGPFPGYAAVPGAGRYFDFAPGHVVVNGSSDHV